VNNKWEDEVKHDPNPMWSYVFGGDDKLVRDFVKLLLGRLVFIQFVQKKRWMGVPAELAGWHNGDVNFLSHEFNAYEHKDLFYSLFLEPLFFETLNHDRPDNIFSVTGTKVPFLNGGLFEKGQLDTSLVNFPQKYFAELFDFFDRYNFTIDENDLEEREVGIDPEMLGHIFENLLEDNKDKGAFYTPKEIVHYMCQESLKEYLKTALEEQKLWPTNETEAQTLETDLQAFVNRKEAGGVIEFDETLATALRDVKICDPAIGSGAFPMGLLNEIYRCINVLYHASPDRVGKVWNMSEWQPNVVKKNIIQSSIYGVDIEKGAVDIARLRFWLSLIVDEPEPEALPNLDYKIVVGNSLVSKLGDDVIDIDWTLDEVSYGLFAEDLAKEKSKLLKKISQKQRDFFNSDHDKQVLSTEIRNLKIDLIINQLKLMIEKQNIPAKPMAADYINKPKAKFVDDTNRYLQCQGWKSTIDKLTRQKTQPNTPLHFFDWKLDFPEIMNEHVAEKVGFDIVIGNPPYVIPKDFSDIEKQYFEKKYISALYQINLYLLFIEKSMFLLLSRGNCTLIVPNTWLVNKTVKLFRKSYLENNNIIFISDLTKESIFDATVLPVIISTKKHKVEKYKFLINEFENKIFKPRHYIENNTILKDSNHLINYQTNQNVLEILNKVEVETIKLDLIAKCSFGVKFYQINKGKPKQTKDIVLNHSFSHDRSINDKCKKILEGKDIDRYYHKFNGKWIEYGEWLAEPRFPELFEGERILLRRIVGKGYLIGQYIEGDFCNNSLLHTVKIFNKNFKTKYVLAILNSKLIGTYFIQKYARDEKTFPEIRIHELSSLPIKQYENQIFIENIADEIIKNKTVGLETKELEIKLDNLVYRIYDLTWDEVRVIDPDFGLSEEAYNAISIE